MSAHEESGKNSNNNNKNSSSEMNMWRCSWMKTFRSEFFSFSQSPIFYIALNVFVVSSLSHHSFHCCVYIFSLSYCNYVYIAWKIYSFLLVNRCRVAMSHSTSFVLSNCVDGKTLTHSIHIKLWICRLWYDCNILCRTKNKLITDYLMALSLMFYAQINPDATYFK